MTNKKIIKIKTLSMLIFISLVLTIVPLSSLSLTTNVKASEDSNDSNKMTISKTISFNDIIISEENEFTTVNIDDLPLSIEKSGYPNLPVHKDIIVLPLGAKNIDIDYSLDRTSTNTQLINNKIKHASNPKVLSSLHENIFFRMFQNFKFLQKFKVFNLEQYNNINIVSDVYDSGIFYPDNRLEYNIGVGLHKGILSTLVPISFYPVQYDGINTINYITGDITFTLTYTYDNEINRDSEKDDYKYDLVILSPRNYINLLRPLVKHKEAHGLKTKLVCLNDIYNNRYFNVDECYDNQEKIKFFIYNSILHWNTKYIMAIGGYRSFLGFNKPNIQFPVRYSHLDFNEPGYVSDQYYSSCIKYHAYHGYVFDDWDSNENDRFAEWDIKGFDYIDPYVDVYFGRLACRNKQEVKTIVNKIIHYETKTYEKDWFNKILTVSGDGFGDFNDLGIVWIIDEPGDYTIYAQSSLSLDSSVKGPIDSVNVKFNPNIKSNITFNESDHLIIEPINDNQFDLFPAKPVAKITSPSNNDVLGYTNVNFVPRKAYGGSNWARVEYYHIQDINDLDEDDNTEEMLGIMIIRGKSYDPSPHEFTWNSPSFPIRPLESYLSITNYSLWIKNSDDDVVFGPVTLISQCGYEGDIETEVGVRYLEEKDFESIRLTTSDSSFSNQENVINKINEGQGFVYFAGHGSPMSWANHHPGIPGGRRNSEITGLSMINFDMTRPLFPMNTLNNKNKLPIVIIGGCHNSEIDCSFLKLFTDPYKVLYGPQVLSFIPECFAWWLVRLNNGGAIASLGFSSLGYGTYGINNANTLSGWLNGEFFRQYSEENIDILGEVVGESLNSYSSNFANYDCENYMKVHRKTFEAWLLLGDPSLKIGGYPKNRNINDIKETSNTNILVSQPANNFVWKENSDILTSTYTKKPFSPYRTTSLITDNLLIDKSPSIASNQYQLVSFIREESIDGYKQDVGFSYSSGGNIWKEVMMLYPDDHNVVSIDKIGYTDSGFLATMDSQSHGFDLVVMNDVTDEDTWFIYNNENYIFSDIGKKGNVVVNAYPHETVQSDGLHWIIGTITDISYTDNYGHNIFLNDIIAFIMPSVTDGNYLNLALYNFENCPGTISGDVDESTLISYWATPFSEYDEKGLLISCWYSDVDHFYSELPGHYLVRASAGSITKNPDVHASNGHTCVAYEAKNEEGNFILSATTSNYGAHWMLSIIDINIIEDITNPKLVNRNGVLECYYLKNNYMYKSISLDNGINWISKGKVEDIIQVDVDSSDSPFDVDDSGIVYTFDDELHYYPFNKNIGAIIDNINVTSNKCRITVEITNTGFKSEDFDCEIKVEGDFPFGNLFGSNSLLTSLLTGRTWLGSTTNKNIHIEKDETVTLKSKPLFGIGHVLVTVTIKYNNEIVDGKCDDGFLIGRKILIHHDTE